MWGIYLIGDGWLVCFFGGLITSSFIGDDYRPMSIQIREAEGARQTDHLPGTFLGFPAFGSPIQHAMFCV